MTIQRKIESLQIQIIKLKNQVTLMGENAPMCATLAIKTKQLKVINLKKLKTCSVSTQLSMGKWI